MDPTLSGLLVRPLLATDLPSVLEMERMTPGAPHWTLADYLACLKVPQDGLERRAWVAESSATPPSDAILGFAVVRGVTAGGCLEFELESLVVRPEIQRRGVGGTLLATVLRQLKTSGASILMLEVRPSNLAAIRLYEGSGITRVGLRRSYYEPRGGIPGEDAILMQVKF